MREKESQKVIQNVTFRTDIKVAPLERGTPRSSVKSTARASIAHYQKFCRPWSPLERHTPRSSGGTKSKRPARAYDDLQRKYWEMNIHARASKCPPERISNNKGPARASKASLECEGQNLGINFWFLNTTNLFQTCLTQPKTQIQRVNDENENKTT